MNKHADHNAESLDAQGTQGFINRPTGPVYQVFGEQRIIYTTYYSEQAKAARNSQYSLRQKPQPPEKYISRQEKEAELKHYLEDDSKPALTILSGMPGIGKTALAAHVVGSLAASAEIFPKGVMWGDLERLPPHDLLRRFLYDLDETWVSADSSHTTSIRELFWQKIGHSPERTLVVLDNIQDLQQLRDLLPTSFDQLTHCRVLVISAVPLEPPGFSFNPINLIPFSEPESMALFEAHLGGNQVKLYKAKLLEISQRLEHIPQLLIMAARDFVVGKITPSTYLGLIQSDGERPFAAPLYHDALTLATRDLTSEQHQLITMFGLIGAGDWSIEMLAAIALRPKGTIRQELNSLIARGLVIPTSADRYFCSTRVRQFAQHHLQLRDQYTQQSAAHLLAHFCLDLIQNHVAALAPSLRVSLSADTTAYAIDESFVQALRERLLPDLVHIHGVLEWARREGVWTILRRFTHLPSLEILKHLTANGFELRLSLMMGTVVEPLILPYGDELDLSFDALITSSNWSVSAPEKGHDVTSDRGIIQPGFRPIPQIQRKPTGVEDERAGTNGLSQGARSSPEGRKHCEISLTMLASRIIDGIVHTARLVDTSWCGVQARGLVLRYVDLVGCALIACDLSNSVWVYCDARRIALRNSSLIHALFHDVQMHGADLEAADLRGVSLEKVDLRGATLRRADLSGARLDEVDLRGADLRETNFCGATLSKVSLKGCRLEGATWAGAREATPLNVGDPVIEHEIREAMKVECKVSIRSHERPPVPVEKGPQALRNHDLRAWNAPSHDLRGGDLRESDLRASDLTGTQLAASILRLTDLRGASLQGADLTAADLSAADLRGTTLEGANLQSADLSYALVRRAYLQGALLPGVKAHTANFQGTILRRANLQWAFLNAADLSGADLRDADLRHALLRSSNLSNANLRNAQLSGADLTGALCDGADFSAAEIAPEQLARAASLQHVILTDGVRVQLLTETYHKRSVIGTTDLRFAYWTGKCLGVDLQGKTLYGSRIVAKSVFSDAQLSDADLRYAHLGGIFSQTAFVRAQLQHAQLTGIFSNTTFTEAQLQEAHVSGTFSDADFSKANFHLAHLQGASLVDADLTDAQNLMDEQLRQASRLRGTILPNGKRYHGRWKLVGDLEDALKTGYDLDDPVQYQAFYSGGMLTYGG